MSTIKINELATTGISLTDFLVKADANGYATKNTMQGLQDFLSTLGDTSFKGTISAGTYATKEAGWYFASNTGNYVIGSTTIAVDVSDTLTLIIVPSFINDSSKVEIPLNISFDATPTAGSVNAVTSEGIKNYADNLKPTIWANVNNFSLLENQKLPIFPYNYNDLTSLGTTSQFLDDGVLVFKNETNLSLKLTDGYDLTNDNGRVLELFFTARSVASGNGFGFSYTRDDVEYNIIYRQNGQLTEYINNSNTNGSVIRNTNATYEYTNNDVLSIWLKIENNIATYKTSKNGVYSDELSKPDASFSSLSYAFKGICEVENPYLYSFLDEEILDIIFVNDSEGTDTNTGKFPYLQPSGGTRSLLNGPLKTITEALSRKAKKIFIVGGTYEDETDLTIDYDCIIQNYKGQEVIIDLGEKHLGNTFTVNGTYSNVYQKSIVDTVTTAFEDDYTKWFDQVDSLLDCSNTEGSCYYNSGVLYVNPINADINAITVIIPKTQGFNIPTPAIDGLGTFTRLVTNLTINGITVLYSSKHGFEFNNININAYVCNAFGSKDNGFYFVDCNGTAKGCNASFNDGDGFNVHAFDDKRGSYIDLIDCVGNDNWGIGQGNDGVSYHELCKGRIIGGEYLRNTKYDIIHVQIAEVQHYDVKCGTLYNVMEGTSDDVVNLQIRNVTAEDITVRANVSIVNVEITNCKTDEISIDGTGNINSDIYSNIVPLIELKALGNNNVIDNKIKGGYGIDVRLGTNYFDGNEILNNDYGFIKIGGTATMGVNNLFGNTQDYAGSSPVSAPEQAKNVSYLSV